ncbi:cyclin, putative [Hepatocystis sp. ex Piliocolobus tephrosceles]|nr:cyclin, putative [Hepatocystis sp. ex Piliocolobus tephrosceles]
MEYEIEADVPRTNKNYIMYLHIVLNKMIMISKNDGKITSFHASEVPSISIEKYIERINKYIGCSNECFVLLMIYLDRIIKIHKDITLSLLCIHRLLITAAMISAKYFDDSYYSNAYYAKVGGITTKEMNKLEATFLDLLDYKLFVSSQEYDLYRKYITLTVQQCITQKINKPITPVVKKTYNLFNYNAPNKTNMIYTYNHNFQDFNYNRIYPKNEKTGERQNE